MKNLIVAVAIAAALAWAAGGALTDWFGMTVYLNHDMLSPLEGLLVFLMLAVVFAVIGFIVAISMLGAIFVGLIAALAGLAVFGISLFWPILLVVALVMIARSVQNRHQTRST